MNSDVKINGVYKHFKGDCYIVEDIATCSETMKPMVIFRSLYDNGELFVKYVDAFFAPIDRGKYPQVQQDRRFELMQIRSVR